MGHEHKVYRSKKTLYGLKQALRAWHSCIDSYFQSHGFSKSNSEPNLYIKVNNQGKVLIVCLYVDDLIFTGNFSIELFKSTMKKEFEMTDLGLMKYFLGIEVSQTDDGIFICQTKYKKDVLKRFNMLNCNPTSTPVATGLKLRKEDKGTKVYPSFFKILVGNLMYMTATRPNIMYAVSLISRFMETPMDSHWLIRKMIFRYITGTRDYGILYSKSSDDFILVGYTYSDFTGNIDDIKSTSGYIFHLGSGAIS